MAIYPYFEDIHEDVRRTARGAAEEFKKTAAEADEKANHSIMVRNLKRLGELNLLGIHIPQKYGGQELGVISYIVVMEEIAKTCASTAGSYDSQTVATDAINHGGTEEQKLKYLPLLCKDKIGAFGLSEPGAGSDAAALRTRAELKGNEYVLNGEKHFITNGNIADIIVVYAVTDPTKQSHGISGFIVENGNPGLKVGKVENKMGIRASPTVELFFENCKIPKENLLGVEGMGFINAMQILDIGRVAVGAISLGLSKAALSDATAYAKERVQFGQPIAQFQTIQFMLADMAVKIEAMENLIYHAAWLIERGKKVTAEASIAKVFSSEAAMDITNKAIQILGGVGYTKDYPVERYHRDAKIADIIEGTSEIQRIVISRALVE